MTKEIATTPSQPVSFQLLGSVEAYADGQRLDLGTERERRLLVALISAKGDLVSRGRLMEWVWDDAPDSAPEALYEVTSDLRKRLGTVGLGGALISKDGWCRLDIPAGWVDVHHFGELTARVQGSDDRHAAELLGEALGLCRGEPLAGLGGQRIDGYRHTLREELHNAELALNEAMIRIGQYRERIPHLAGLFHDRPGDEGVAWLFMHALFRAGRQAEAQNVYREVRKRLDRTIAAESLKALAELHERILCGDHDLLSPEAVAFPVGRPVLSSRASTSHDANGEPDDQGDQGEDRDEPTTNSRRAGPEPVAHDKKVTSIIAGSIKNSQVFNEKVEIAGDWNVS